MPQAVLFILLFIVALMPGFQSQAQADAVMQMETFNLRNRPANDLLPLVKAFLHPEGAIRAQGYKLFIKSTGSNLEQLSKIIADLDVALKQLRVSISTDTLAFEEQEKLQLHNHSEAMQSSDSPDVQKIIINKGPQHKITTKVYSTAQRSRQPSSQHVKLLEGQWATINTGHAIPIADRRINADGTVTQTISYRKVTSSLKLRAHVNGNKVYLTLHPKNEQLSEQGGGVIETQSIETNLTIGLDQWTEIGGTQELESSSEQGITYSTRRKQKNERRVFIKVELLK